jgi:hypothetical protein
MKIASLADCKRIFGEKDVFVDVVLSARVKPSYRIRLNPCLPSLAQ